MYMHEYTLKLTRHFVFLCTTHPGRTYYPQSSSPFCLFSGKYFFLWSVISFPYRMKKIRWSLDLFINFERGLYFQIKLFLFIKVILQHLYKSRVGISSIHIWFGWLVYHINVSITRQISLFHFVLLLGCIIFISVVKEKLWNSHHDLLQLPTHLPWIKAGWSFQN